MSASEHTPLDWPGTGTHRIPFGVYTSAELHRLELERLFYKNHWHYVGLEAEVPQPGDFKRTVVGERSVVLVRALDGQLHVVENVCKHRGMQPQGVCLPLPPMELHAQRRSAGRALSPWGTPGGQGPWRHARRFRSP